MDVAGYCNETLKFSHGIDISRFLAYAQNIEGMGTTWFIGLCEMSWTV